MKLLLDTCVWGGAAATLAAAGHDARWMGEIPLDPGDKAVLGIAFDEGRVLITIDKNFGELAIVYGKPQCGIIRLVDLPARQQGTYSRRTGSVRGRTVARCHLDGHIGARADSPRGLTRAPAQGNR